MSAGSDRLERLDALRGTAIVWMVGFHFCFDLNLLGWWQPRQHFLGDPFWTVQRTLIVTLFLLCAGLGQSIALVAGQGWPRFWRRWAQVAGCALAVSAGSAWMFPNSWIRFGVLHGVAVMLVLTRWGVPMLLARGRGDALAVQAPLWLLGGLALVARPLFAHALFNGPWLSWTGLVTRLPVTEDYVPLLPWLGVMLWGVALGLWVQARRPRWLAGRVPGLWRPLVWLGQRPLTIYMLHQPLLLGALWLLGRLTGH